MTTTAEFRPAMSAQSKEAKAVIKALAVIWKNLTVTQVANIAYELNVPISDFFGALEVAARASTDN